MIAASRTHPRLESIHNLIARELEKAHVELRSALAALNALSQCGHGEQRNEVEREVARNSNVLIGGVETAVWAEKDAVADDSLSGLGAPNDHV